MRGSNLHIVADENIPGLDMYAPAFGSIQKVAAAHITTHLLAQSDVLLVRSVTRIDESLLHGTAVRFVGSATAGLDHVDLDYLAENDIAFTWAPGSNAVSVVEYVLAALAVLATQSGRRLSDLTAGVIGCGHVGSRLAVRLEALGIEVLRNDPPRAQQEGGDFVDLTDVLEQADVLSLHTPLTRTGPFPTLHLISHHELAKTKRDAWLINAARGAVVDSTALLDAIKDGSLGHVVLDVWEDEPNINTELLDVVSIATPHVAGYSVDAKLQGTRRIMQALFDFLGMDGRVDEADETLLHLTAPDPWLAEDEMLRFLIGQMYDIRGDDARMRTSREAGAPVAEAFRRLRRDYPPRFTFGRYVLAPSLVPRHLHPILTDGLGIRLEPDVPVVRAPEELALERSQVR